MDSTTRQGSALIDVLVALVLVALSATFTLQAAAATERAIGDTSRRREATHRALLALADLRALPCDTVSATRSATEPRWQISATRRSAGDERRDRVIMQTNSGDTLSLERLTWCGQ